MKKILPYVALLGVLIIAIAIYNVQNNVRISAQSGGSQSLQPSHLRIPALSIDASVIGVGVTSSGQMDAPTSPAINSPYWTSVFWYTQGAAPGQEGNAVIAGHVDRVGGSPAIFWSLNTLKIGDLIYVQNSDNSTLKFAVDHIVSYPADSPGRDAINAVFGPTTAHHLNLITCSGLWIHGGFDKRLVVFTTQVV